MSERKRYFLDFFAVFGCFTTTALLIVSFVFYRIDSFVIDLNKTLGFWGVVVSAVALVVSCCFVFLAFDAYRHIREIAELKKKIEDSQKSFVESLENLEEAQKNFTKSQEIIAESQKSLATSRKNFAESMWDSYTLQYASLSKLGNAGSIATYVLLSRGRLGYLFPMLEPQQRIQCVSDLAKVGTQEDMAPLRRIFNDPSESQAIRHSAGFAHNAICARLRQELAQAGTTAL